MSLRSYLLSVCYFDNMSMVFRYLDSTNPNGAISKRPSILAVFSNGQEKLELYALVDSGADMSAMDYRIAEKLHLNLDGKKVVSYGVSGAVKSVITEVTIELGKGHEHYTLSIPIRVLFTKSDYIAPTLIGRKGFFDKFRITFDEYNQKVIMKNNGQD